MSALLPGQCLACHDCDALVETPDLRPGQKVVCPRCTALLMSFQHNSLHRTAAFALGAAVLFVVSNMFPFMTLRAGFRESEMHLWQSVSGLAEQGYAYLATAVATFILAAPSMLIIGLLYLIVPLLNGRRLPGAILLARWVHRARRWNMIEVFLVGVLVSLIRLGKLATLNLGTSFWAFVGLIICLTAAITSIHPREIWLRLDEASS